MTTADDREFAYWHRVASESLIGAATNADRVSEQLDTAKDYGRRAFIVAVNGREQMLAMGLLMTVEGLRLLHETGREALVVPHSSP